MVDTISRGGVRVRAFCAHHPLAVAWLLSALAWALYLERLDPTLGIETTALGGDEYSYMFGANQFTGSWTLDGYVHTYRGVVFPWLVRQVVGVSAQFGVIPLGARVATTAAAVISLVTIPLLTSVIAPSIARSLTGRRPSLARVALFNLVVLAFWRNDSVRLLTDLPAVTLMGGGLAILLRHVPSQRRSVWAAGAVGAGLLAGLTINLRPAYVVPVAVLFVGLPLLVRRQVVFATWALVLVGLAVSAAPQVLVNASMGAPPGPLPSGVAGIGSQQVALGLKYQRYDTYVGKEASRLPNRRFADNSPNLGEVDPDKIDSYSSLVDLSLTHPDVVAESMARHVFNGLDLQRAGTYIEDEDADAAPYQSANFVLVWSSAWVLAVRTWRAVRDRRLRRANEYREASPGIVWLIDLLENHPRRRRLWFGSVVISSVLVASVTAVETRFLLPLWLVMTGTLILTGDLDDLPDGTASRIGLPVAIAALTAASMTASSVVAESVLPTDPEKCTGFCRIAHPGHRPSGLGVPSVVAPGINPGVRGAPPRVA